MSNYKMNDFYLKFDGYTVDVELNAVDGQGYEYLVTAKKTLLGEEMPDFSEEFKTDDFDSAREKFVSSVRFAVLGLPYNLK